MSYGSYNCFVGFHCPWFKLWNALYGVPNLDAKFSISWRVSAVDLRLFSPCACSVFSFHSRA